MNFVVFDTETTSLDKPFCYNIGYIIANENGETLVSREYVVEQIWHNLPLFSTAYYAEKRSIYIQAMRSRSVKMDKFGYICQQMIRDFKFYEVENAFAYNSNFDERVFAFNCDWFKCANPFDNITIKDIRGFAHHFIVNDEYKLFCEQNNLFSESGNYSSTAEAVYRFISQNTDFIESHTALDDSRIEKDILLFTVSKGADLNENYSAFRSIERKQLKTLRLIDTEKEEHFFNYYSIRINKDRTEIKLR